MKIIGHCGFRKGSKGVPSKNTRTFHGKPLFEWTIQQLKALPDISDIVVSTDDEEAYSKAISLGCLKTGLRDESLSNDTASKFLVWKDSAKKYLEGYGDFDIMLDLDCTAPLRLLADIKNVLNLFNKNAMDIAIAITESRKNPYFNLMEYSDDGFLEISKGSGQVFSRQSAPEVYEHVSSIYVISKEYLIEGNNLYEARIKGHKIPYERSLDIDTPLDWEIVNYLFKKNDT
tara:strand:- start:1636 stop:2328 length:693 start_codon:yes stop_codon:yes gene_type:complete